MESSFFALFCLCAGLAVQAQECVTQRMDARSPQLVEEVERELAGADFAGQRSITYLQTVVHVLWNSPNHNLTDSVVQANIDLVNKDLRRQNTDTNETPDYFLPVAADTEIELRLAQVDPNGQPTNGITHTYTDSIEFHVDLGHMKYDSTGGKTAWNPENYLNIWVINDIEAGIPFGGVLLGFGTLPESLPAGERGVVIRTSQFLTDHGWRTLTHEFGHFACLLHPEAHDTCYDADLVADTPIGSDTLIVSCTDTAITCDNGPYGNMHMNFMSSATPSCANIFTLGQKNRMLNCLQTHYPGLLGNHIGVDEHKQSRVTVFPNPARSSLRFRSEFHGTWTIVELSGRRVITGRAAAGINDLDVASLPKGIYLLQLQTKTSVSSARFVKN